MEDALTRRLKIYQRQIIMNLTRRRQGCKNETQNRFIYDHCCYYSYDYDNLWCNYKLYYTLCVRDRY